MKKNCVVSNIIQTVPDIGSTASNKSLMYRIEGDMYMHTSRTMYQSSFTPNHKSKHPVAQFCSQLNEIYFVLHLFFQVSCGCTL